MKDFVCILEKLPSLSAHQVNQLNKKIDNFKGFSFLELKKQKVLLVNLKTII